MPGGAGKAGRHAGLRIMVTWMATSLSAGQEISKTRSVAEKLDSSTCETADFGSAQPTKSPASLGIVDDSNAGRLSPVEASIAWHRWEVAVR